MARSGGGQGGRSGYDDSVLTYESAATSLVPYVKVEYTSATQSGGTSVTTTIQATGSTTPNLILSSTRVGIQTVRCKLTHPVAVNKATSGSLPVTRANSPIYTNTVNFETISRVNEQRSNVTYEITKDWNTNFGSGTVNLHQQSLNLAATSANPNRTVTLYAPEENIQVEIQLSGGAGDGFNGGGGGRGGGARFLYTLIKDEEYTFKFGYNTDENGTASLGRGGAGAYFYEKGVLLVACGGGGASGWGGGTGGNGGGAGQAGEAGNGSGAGSGGLAVSTGQLPASGVQSSGTIGGKVESCTSGVYWAQQGISPCSTLGTSYFRDYQGNAVTASALMLRGYKAASNQTSDAGWNGFRTNGGFSQSHVGGTFVGGGGSGAYGGNAASNTSSGGGGGSGYTNGAVTILSAQPGVNVTNFSSAEIRIP